MKLDTQWPAEAVERRPVADLIPYARNPRTHTAKQVEQIAASIKRFGWTMPCLVDEAGEIIAGHGRVMAAELLGIEEAPCMVAEGWSEAEKRAYVIADNQLTLNGAWDQELLALEVQALADLDFDLELLGLDDKTIGLLLNPNEPADLGDADRFAGVEVETVTEAGDLWVLGEHRLLCGDSTDAEDVAQLMDQQLADLVHADPPYGMGKEADGVHNDNLYAEKLDAFQMAWVGKALLHARENCGLYIWGQAPDLWRLWYQGGLQELDDLAVRNELVWAKGSAIGVGGEGAHSYPPETERCLFLMRGQQVLGNQNKDEYWEGFEPLRSWLCAQRDALRWKAKDINRITGTSMAGHWFGKSQFAVIPRMHYETLRAAALGLAFELSHEMFLQKFSDVISKAEEHREQRAAQFRDKRTYFDAVKEASTDVWRFGSVVGDERYGHATPKPAAMIGRAVITSCPEGGLVYEPFAGTGTTLIAAHATGRRCYSMELEPAYVDVVIRRWQERTGREAVLDSSGQTFNQTKAKRT